MQIKELVAIVRADIESFKARMREVGTITNDFQSRWTNAAGAVTTSFNRMATAALAFFGGIAAYTAKVGVSFRAMTDNAEVMLTTLTGSAAKAKQTLADLLKFSKETPFEFNGVRAASIQLLNAKIKAEELIPVLRKIGDAVASVGGGDEALRGVSVALAQMMTAGRVNAQDMMQLTNRGIAGWDMLAKRLGKSVAEVRELSEKGALDGRESAMLIIDEMGKRGQGAAAAMSLRFTGLWSSLKDDFSQFCDKVWEPLYTSMVSVMGRISKGFNSGGMEPILKRLQAAVREVTDTLLNLIAAHGEQAINNLVSAFVWLAQATARCVVALRDMMPTLTLTAQRVWEFLNPLFQFLARNPELIAAFLALKVTGVLGLNTAFVALIQALLSTLGLLGKLPALLAALGPMMAAVFATPPVIAFSAALAAAAAAYVLYKKKCDDATASKVAFDDAQKAGAKDLQDGFMQGRTAEDLHANDKVIREARQKEKEARAAGDNREADSQKFAAEQAEKKRNNVIAELRGVREGTEKQVADLRQSARQKFDAGDKEGGAADLNKSLEVQRVNAEVIRKIEETLKSYFTKVEQDRMARQADEAKNAEAPKGPSRAETKLDAKIRDLENKGDQKRDSLPGLDKMRDLLMSEGMNAGFAGRIAGAQTGAGAGDVQQFNAEYAKIDPKDKEAVDELTEWFLSRLKTKLDAASVQKEIVEGSTKTAHTVNGLASEGNLDAQQVRQFTDQLIGLNKAFTAGTISEQEYKLGLGDIQNAAKEAARETERAAKEMQSNLKLGDKSLADMRQKLALTLSPSSGTAAYMAGVATAIQKLQGQLAGGKISLEDYKTEIARLEQQTEKATQAERERRLINGDFAGAGLNFQQSFQSKLAAARESQWQQWVDGFVQQAMGVGTAMGSFQTGLQGLGTNIQFVGNQFQAVGNQFSAGGGGFDPAVAAQQMQNLFNSAGGQATMIQNNIALLQQNLQIFQGNYAKQVEIQGQIDALQGELNNLLAPRQQILTPTDPSFMRDPGMQSGGNRSVSINLPNVSRLTQADSRLIADTVRDEINRRGSSALK